MFLYVARLFDIEWWLGDLLPQEWHELPLELLQF